MSEEKFKELYEKYSKVTDPVQRAQISYGLFGKIAADMENGAPGIEGIRESMGDQWLAAAERFEVVLKNDPDEAFNMAVQLTTLPVSSDRKIEDINKWLRGDGPGMLGRDELRKKLLDHLADEQKSQPLTQKLTEYVSYDFSNITDSQDAFEDPSCYLSLSSILLGLKLGENADLGTSATNLSEQVKSKFNDKDVIRVINYYHDLPDTKWLADELNSFKVK